MRGGGRAKRQGLRQSWRNMCWYVKREPLIDEWGKLKGCTLSVVVPGLRTLPSAL